MICTRSFYSLLSTNRDSTYRDDDPRSMDDFNSNGTRTIAKSSSCSSFLIDILFRGIGYLYEQNEQHVYVNGVQPNHYGNQHTTE